jgi:hypothetical protein
VTQKIWKGTHIAPKRRKPLPVGLVEQHTDADKNHRRAAVRRVGSRQFKKIKRAMRLSQGGAL